jgi:hypothetical protein
MNTANFYILPKSLWPHQGLRERQPATTGQRSLSRSEIEKEPEARLWNVCAEAACPWVSVFESVAFLLFGAVSLYALVYGFCELHHFFGSGALDQLVRAFFTK